MKGGRAARPAVRILSVLAVRSLSVLFAALVLAPAAGILLTGGWPPVARHGPIATSYADEDDEESESLVRAPSRVRVENGHIELVLSGAGVRNAGIVTARPISAPGGTSTQAYGEVLDAAALSDSASRYRNAAAQATAAQARMNASRAALARARALYRDRQNASAAQLQGTESAFQSDEAQLGAAKASLSAIETTLAQTWGPVLASAMTRDSALFESLVARRAYLIAVTLPPGIVPARAPPTAESELPNGASLKLEFVSPGVTTSPLVQGLRYYYRAPAAPGLLAGLSLPVALTTDAGARGAVVVPESAVVWLQGKPWVYRLAGTSGPGASSVFTREPIAPERQENDGGYVVSGFSPGAQIVIRGAQLLLSEEFRAQVEAHASD